MLDLVKNDSWLAPYESAIQGRVDYYEQRLSHFTQCGHRTLSDFATGHLYYGLHRTKRGWVLREWAPNATAIYLVGDLNGWQELPDYAFRRLNAHGDWELSLSSFALHHGSLYKLKVSWNGGSGFRIPAYATRVVQDSNTRIFCAQVWCPDEPYVFRVKRFRPQTSPLLIYECHVGMAQEEERVGTYNEFRERVLPRVIDSGYNCLQIMAIQEHPYYGSFGYHVSNFFAPSSRFGTPEELKQLIDEAHAHGVAVIMDLVHSHAVRNEEEGLGLLSGDPYQYFMQGERRIHPAWDSLCFDYGKDDVIHFLLSNCRYWLDEFHFDGFRFDGVTSMIYRDHGLGVSFGSYGDYYNLNEDLDAICYLTLANTLIHEACPTAITIAEEVSGMPGLAAPVAVGGYGFDYRMAMNIPDYWIKIIKEQRDEEWKPTALFWELTNRRADERTVSYAESHDQALVGDKTIIFRLVDEDMYWHFEKNGQTYSVSRGIALHKMIRLLTASTINGAYLNFMGNEFGHPEWIDFPRDGNGWSHKYARRQWSLRDRDDLCYSFLGLFDKALMMLVGRRRGFQKTIIHPVCQNDGDQVLAFRRGDLLFVFNFNPVRSYCDYGFLVPSGAYRDILSTDDPLYGGQGLSDSSLVHSTSPDPLYRRQHKEWLHLYLPARTATVLCKQQARTLKHD